MTQDLFPIIPSPPEERSAQMPLYRDVAMDYERGVPIFANGNPLIAEGLEAVKGWAWRMLKTARYRYSHFSWDVGCELESLVGQPYQMDTKLAEASRCVYDALMISPYITSVQVVKAEFQGSTLTITATLTTVYGEVTLHV